MGVWLSGDNGQDTDLGNFALMYLEKGQNSKFCLCLCRCRKHYIFPYAVSCWAHVGLVVLFFFFFVFFGATSLGPRPTLFLLVCFWFSGCLLGVVFIGLVCFCLTFVLRIRQTYFS